MASRALLVRMRLGATAAIALLLASAACSNLKRADEPPASDDAGNGSNSGAGDADPGDAGVDADATVDVGQPPDDTACGLDEWKKPTKTKAECALRLVKVITSSAPIDVNAVAIARTPAGRVGIVYNSEEGAETGEMHLAHFMPTAPNYLPPQIVKRATGFAFHDGYVSKIAASAPDTLAVLSYDMDDTSFSGEVHLRKLVGGFEPLTDDLAFTAVKSPTEIAIASDPAGNVYVSARIATGATTAKLSTRIKPATSGFAAPFDLTTALSLGQAPGAGATSIYVDQGSQVHLLYHHVQFSLESNPRYHSLAGTSWSFQKTIDNAVPDGLSGFSPRIVAFGTKKYAAFFFRRGAQTAFPIADLRLATWDAAMDAPSIEIIQANIPSTDAMYPAYRVAMGVDKYGLVHLAIIQPTTMVLGTLTYKRQVRVPSGGTKWLEDVVDSDVYSQSNSAFVDMIVDENARPHIAYRSGVDGKIYYATRFDR